MNAAPAKPKSNVDEPKASDMQPTRQRGPFGWPIDLWRSANLLFVCMTFTFLTTSIFLKYHMAILTMPSYRLPRLWRDFSFAALQGFLFGVALLYPPSLCLVLFSILAASFLIQRIEVGSLVRFLAQAIPQDKKIQENPAATDAEKRRYIRKQIKNHCFKDWENPSIIFVSLLLLSFVVGISNTCIGIYIDFQKEASPFLFRSRIPAVALLVGINAIITTVVLVLSCVQIDRGGDFIRHLDRKEAPEIVQTDRI